MPGLLVSVRNASEAETALRAGADLIDVKEPRHGSLGAPTHQAVEAVVRAVGGGVPVSVALGELGDAADVSRLFGVPGVQYAKAGLAGVPEQWRQIWRGLLDQLPATVAPVAVGYADWRWAAAPSLTDVLNTAIQLGCTAFLLDTHGKQRGALLDCMTLEEVGRLVGRVRAAGLTCVIAGSLTADTISQVVRVDPDYIAVRGAACRGDRSGVVDGGKVRQLVDLVRQGRSSAAGEVTPVRV